MNRNQFFAAGVFVAVGVGAFGAETHQHLSTQIQESFFAANANNNNTTAAFSMAIPIKTNIETDAALNRFLEPPYSGNQNIPTGWIKH